MLRLHVVTPLLGGICHNLEAALFPHKPGRLRVLLLRLIKPNEAHSPWKLQQVLNWAYTHGYLPLNVVMHHTHDQKQWLKLCDRVNFQAKFPAERGTERCEEKAPVERKDTWIWQPSACGRTGLNGGVLQKHERILLQTRANIYSGLVVLGHLTAIWPKNADQRHRKQRVLRRTFLVRASNWGSFDPLTGPLCQTAVSPERLSLRSELLIVGTC